MVRTSAIKTGPTARCRRPELVVRHAPYERRELVWPLWLEGCSVEEPDRESANRDDAEEDQDEGDIGLPLRVVLGEPVHALVRTRRHDARRLAKTYGRNADAWCLTGRVP